MSTIIIEKINELVQECENILPSIEEITKFEQTLLELNRLTFGRNTVDLITENAKIFKGTNTECDILGLEQRKKEMAIQEEKIKDLKNQLSVAETQYKKKLGDKEILQEKMKEFLVNRDIILTFKLGTISHLSYNKKIKFGFLMNKNTIDYKTFAFELDENSPKDVEDRWTLLKSFICSGENQCEDA